MSIDRNGQSWNRTRHSKAASRSFSPDKGNSRGTSLVEVLWELRDLLEGYSPVWYTEEHKARVESALRLGLNNSVANICIERQVLLQEEQTAWNEFRRVRDLKSSTDCEIIRSHDIAIETSLKLHDHFLGCQQCKECARI